MKRIVRRYGICLLFLCLLSAGCDLYDRVYPLPLSDVPTADLIDELGNRLEGRIGDAFHRLFGDD